MFKIFITFQQRHTRTSIACRKVTVAWSNEPNIAERYKTSEVVGKLPQILTFLPTTDLSESHTCSRLLLYTQVTCVILLLLALPAHLHWKKQEIEYIKEERCLPYVHARMYWKETSRQTEWGRRGEGGRRQKGEVTNIWDSSGRATRALIELYKSLILHPHFLHRAPPIDGQLILKRSPFRSLMFALFRREVSKFSRPLYLRSNGIFMQCEIKICFVMPIIILYKSYRYFYLYHLFLDEIEIESLILKNNTNTRTCAFMRMCFLKSK